MTVKTDELVALNKIYKIEFKCCLYYTTLSYYLQYDLRIIVIVIVTVTAGPAEGEWQGGLQPPHFF